jgi:mannosyltransferase
VENAMPVESTSSSSALGSLVRRSPRELGDAATGLLLAVIISAAAVLRLHAISAKPIWFDEALSFGVARLPLRPLLHSLWNREANMGVYFLLLHFWLSLGSTLGFLRGLSVLFSVATIPIVYALGACLFGRNAGLIAAGLLAINAFHIRYAQEIRGYAMVAFFATLATWLLVRNLQEPSSAHWAAYTAACALTVYSQFLGAFVILVHFLSLTYLRPKDIPIRALVRSYFWLAVSLLPVAIFSIRARFGTVNWIPQLRFSTFLNFWEVFGGNYGLPLLSLEAVAIGLFIFGGIRSRDQEGHSLRGWGYALVLAWLFVPVFLILAISIVHPLFVFRYLIPSLPALALVVAAGIVNLKPFALSAAFCVVISVLSVLGTVSYYRGDFDIIRGDWQDLFAYVYDHAQPGDGIVFYNPASQTVFDFYGAQRKPVPVWPETLNPQDGDNEKFDPLPGMPALAELENSRPAGDRVWLVLYLPVSRDGTPDTKGAIIRDWYAKGRRRIYVNSWTSIGLILYARDPADSSKDRAASK